MPSSQDKNKCLQEKFQAILYSLLRDEDNKYCVDCDAKGPRWASWNLGVFLCIRCAGIHRNLGVHVSRVKSVNLDSWTEEQIAIMQEIGNSRGRAIYEANIPDHFRRPQIDSALEAFIRAKYEQKKYIAAEWSPPKTKTLKFELQSTSINKSEKVDTETRERSKHSHSNQSKPLPSKISAAPVVKEVNETPLQQSSQQPAKVESDLLGLDEAPCGPSSSVDLFGDFVKSSTNYNVQRAGTATVPSIQMYSGVKGEDQLNLQGNLFEIGSASNETAEGKKVSKDAIMALYGPPQNNTFGVPMGPDRNGYMPAMQHNMVGQMMMYPGQQQPSYYQPAIPYQLQNMQSRLGGLNISGGVHEISKPPTAPQTWAPNQPPRPANPSANWSTNQIAPSITNGLWQ